MFLWKLSMGYVTYKKRIAMNPIPWTAANTVVMNIILNKRQFFKNNINKKADIKVKQIKCITIWYVRPCRSCKASLNKLLKLYFELHQLKSSAPMAKLLALIGPILVSGPNWDLSTRSGRVMSMSFILSRPEGSLSNCFDNHCPVSWHFHNRFVCFIATSS